VRLVKNELQHAETGCSNFNVLELLKGLPQELEELYERMFSRLENCKNKWDIQDAIRFFRFVLFALRPLTLEELRDTLAVPDDHNPHHEKFTQNKMRDIGKRIAHCGSDFLETKGKAP
jgi:hypothetical protein